MSDRKGSAENVQREGRRVWLIGVGTAVLIGALTAAVTGVGQRGVDAVFGEQEELISFGVEELRSECGTITYLPGTMVEEALQKQRPYELEEWDAFQTQPMAADAGDSIVQISIQGESARTITLTGIRFSAAQRPRQQGATFAAPCGDSLIGRGLLVDVESDPPQVISSSEGMDGYIEGGGPEGLTSPITFPWTVSVTDPLLLIVVATARVCDCRWTAEIPWVSGSEKGTIHIDNGGHGFRVVGAKGLPGYVPGEENWIKSH